MKKFYLTLVTASLATSLGVYAAIPTDAQSYQIIVPNLKSGIAITLEGLYLQPSNSNLDYANVQTLSASFNNENVILNNTTNLQTVDPDYNFGFRIGLGYTFPNSGNDIQVAWTHFNHTDSDTTVAANNSFLTTALGHTNFVNGPFNDVEKLDLFTQDLVVYDEASVTSDVKFRLDSIDLDVGQFIDIGTRLRMRMFAGLRFAEVRNDQTTTQTATGSFSAQPTQRPLIVEDEYSDQEIEQFSSKFTGIGPRFGIDSSYHVGNCFGVTAHAAMALLVGQVDANTTANNNFTVTETIILNGEAAPSQTSSVNTKTTINSDNVTRVVPALDAKLGLNWSYIFSNDSVLTLEGGYQLTQYIDAVDKLTTDDFNNVIRTTSSVSFEGPYLSLNWSV